MLRVKFTILFQDNISVNSMPAKYIWDQTSADIFRESLNDKHFVDQFNSFLHQEHDASEKGVNIAVCQLSDIITSVADLSLKKHA